MSVKLQEKGRGQTKLAVTIALNVIHGFIRDRSRNLAYFCFFQKFAFKMLLMEKQLLVLPLSMKCASFNTSAVFRCGLND